MALPLVNFAVLAVSLTEVNPGLTFWTIVTFLVVFLVLRWKAWGPILQMVREREKAIEDAIGAAKRERQEAERLLAAQKQAIEQARREAAELVKKNQAEVEKAREELLAKSRKDAEQLVATALRQIEDEKVQALAQVRAQAADLAIAAAGKLIESSMDEGKQRKLVEEFLHELDKSKLQA